MDAKKKLRSKKQRSLCKYLAAKHLRSHGFSTYQQLRKAYEKALPIIEERKDSDAPISVV